MFEKFFEASQLRIDLESETHTPEISLPDYPKSDGLNPAILQDRDFEIVPIDTWPVSGEKMSDLQQATRLIDDGKISVPAPLSDDDRKLLDGAIRKYGFEALAFYKSRRDIEKPPCPGKWGIFYLEHGIRRIMELIEATYPGHPGLMQLSYEFLRKHERLHFEFDAWALSVEAKIGRSLYDPMKRALRNHLIHQVEEALANHAVWEWSKKKRVDLKEFAYDFMKLQPGAYARFDENKYDLSAELAANLIDWDFSGMARRYDQALWVANIPDELSRRSLCPEYLVMLWRLTDWINPAYALPSVKQVIEAASFTKQLNSKYASLKKQWSRTKEKLIAEPGLPGLDFKYWDKVPDHWSVRINNNFRAHLHPINYSDGVWEADNFGPHTAMGHG
jgi:hypothetical protein